MYAHVIDKILKKENSTKKIFLGVFARDELPKKIKYPACFVANTQTRSEPGEHWLAFYYDSAGNCDFFDSYGLHPRFYSLESYLKSTSKTWRFNKIRIQGSSDFCGLYCIIFLIYKSKNKKNDFYNEFYLDSNKNDKKIFKYIKMFLK